MHSLLLECSIANAFAVATAVLSFAFIKKDLTLSLIVFLLGRWSLLAFFVPFRNSFSLTPAEGVLIPLAMLYSWLGITDSLLARRWLRIKYLAAAASCCGLALLYVTRHVIFYPSALITYSAGAVYAVLSAPSPSAALFMAVFILGFMSDAREYSILFYLMPSAHIPWYFILTPHPLAWMASLYALRRMGLIGKPSKGWRLMLFLEGLALTALANAYPIIKHACSHAHPGYCTAFLALTPLQQEALSTLLRASPLLIAASLINTVFSTGEPRHIGCGNG